MILRIIFATTIAFGFSIMPDDPFEAYSEDVPGVDLPIAFVPVTGGTFDMGSPDHEAGRKPDEGPVHKVTVDDFWMAKYEITWEQYESFVYRQIAKDKFAANERLQALGIDGVSGATPPYVEMSFGMGKDGYPAVNVTQYAAIMFCKWLSASTGKFYRIPTEAEWEYACRAGTNTMYSFGDDASLIDEYAVYKSNSNRKYAKIGTKKPNPWGLYDMHGNVAEWTMDQYSADTYKKSKKKNPWVKPDKLYPRVARGGAWNQEADQLRSAARLPSESKWKQRDPQLPKSRWWLTNAPFVGIRVIRPRVEPPAKEINEFWLNPIEDYGQ
ncbi:MAG: formylglycine-generating enzyme family protein [Cyclobacteriaceae bacterium]|nr:formylglycine-generating enzyme family protein [Cyclobacteriaceae bacterium]